MSNSIEHMKKLTASQEDYLEAVFHLADEGRDRARVKDIAARMKVKYASVTGALRSLSKAGLINYKPYGPVTLTGEGLIRAREVVRRHRIFYRFFTEVLGADDKEAEVCACRMEHAITPNLMARFTDFVEHRTRAG